MKPLLTVTNSIQESEAEASSRRNLVGQQLPELLPVDLGVVCVEFTVASRVNPLDEIDLHFLPVNLNVSQRNNSLETDKTNTDRNREGLAHLLQSNPAAVTHNGSKPELLKNGLGLFNGLFDDIFLFCHLILRL
jgi:hypothetical protein